MGALALQKTRVKAVDGLTRIVNPQEYADEVLKESGSSFYWPLSLLSAEKRDAMSAIYAFCRVVDDETDKNRDSAAVLRKLSFFSKQISTIYKSDGMILPTHPIAKALAYHIRKFNLPQAPFQEIINGCEMDANGAMNKPESRILDQYCEKVASSVGLLSIEVFGYKNENSKRFAINLGKFLQLTNILRDVVEDANNGRIYLPLEILKKHGLQNITPEEILQNPYSQNLQKAYSDIGAIAEQYLKNADNRLTIEDFSTMRPALFMREIYVHYFNVMQQNNWCFSQTDLSLSFVNKIKMFGKILYSSPR